MSWCTFFKKKVSRESIPDWSVVLFYETSLLVCIFKCIFSFYIYFISDAALIFLCCCPDMIVSDIWKVGQLESLTSSVNTLARHCDALSKPYNPHY